MCMKIALTGTTHQIIPASAARTASTPVRALAAAAAGRGDHAARPQEDIMQIAIFNQQCTRGGERSLKAESEDNHGDDYLWEEVSEENAAAFDKLAAGAGAGSDLFYARCARTIREAL